jgi:hypothetical protein
MLLIGLYLYKKTYMINWWNNRNLYNWFFREMAGIVDMDVKAGFSIAIFHITFCWFFFAFLLLYHASTDSMGPWKCLQNAYFSLKHRSVFEVYLKLFSGHCFSYGAYVIARLVLLLSIHDLSHFKIWFWISCGNVSTVLTWLVICSDSILYCLVPFILW